MSTQHAIASLRIPQAFNFSTPSPAQSRVHLTRGKWVVRFFRERFTRTVRDWAYFQRKTDAIAFYRANTEGRA